MRLVAEDGAGPAAKRVAVDVAQRMPGRGAYLCPVPQCGVRAARRGALSRALRQPVAVGEELASALGSTFTTT